ncbi:hypothetical protein ACC780_37775, partial [Rhizobium ruizarguesonis]
ALGDIERAVVERDRQFVVIDRPESLEKHFGLAAGVDEEQRRAMFDKIPVDIGNGIASIMPASSSSKAAPKPISRSCRPKSTFPGPAIPPDMP